MVGIPRRLSKHTDQLKSYVYDATYYTVLQVGYMDMSGVHQREDRSVVLIRKACGTRQFSGCRNASLSAANHGKLPGSPPFGVRKVERQSWGMRGCDALCPNAVERTGEEPRSLCTRTYGVKRVRCQCIIPGSVNSSRWLVLPKCGQVSPNGLFSCSNLAPV